MSTTTTFSATDLPEDLSTASSSYALGTFTVTNTPISTISGSYEFTDSNSMRTDTAMNADEIHVNIHKDKDTGLAHESMQNHIKSLNSPRSIQYLIHVSIKFLTA